MITFQREMWETFWRDGQPIFPIHFKELALNQEKIPMDMDAEVYQKLEDRNVLHILTARKDSKLIGYHISLIVKSHPHNKNAGMYATTDMFYILPEYRKGGAGTRLLIAAEKAIQNLGVTRMALSTKLHHLPNRELLEKLGWTATDIVFHKLL